MNLILCNGFNYYNRIVKKYDTYTDYYQFMDDGAPIIENINFNPADGVNTIQVVNWTYKTPDYVVVLDSNNEINSRWFVIDATRTRAGQLSLELHRDLIVDNYSKVIEAPVYIEKATIKNATDIALYNQEDIAFNSIKQSENLLKDSTGVPWVVGYFSPKMSADQTINVPSATRYDLIGTYETTQDFYDDIGYDDDTGWVTVTKQTVNWVYVGIPIYTTAAYKKYYINATDGTYSSESTATGLRMKAVFVSSGKTIADLTNLMHNNLETIKEKFIECNGYHTTFITNYNNKYVMIGSNLYQIKITETTGSTYLTSAGTSNFGSALADIVTNEYGSSYAPTTTSDAAAKTYYKYNTQVIALEEVTDYVYHTTITGTSKRLTDAPYRMFAMPLRKVTCRINSSTTFDTIDFQNDVLNIASTIATVLDANLYDIQLLPFFPMVNDTTYWSDNELKLVNLTDGIDYSLVTDGDGDNRCVIIYCPISKFSFDVSNSLSLPDTIVDKKIVGQCDTYRLCSPNYASIFEFNLLKTGSLTKFNVDCTYKPYSPYIHVNPVWAGLYGQDFDDTRGLICQGDFSLPIITDEWRSYQLQNKNYLNSFNRQIDSIELQNKYAKQADVLNVITGTVTGAVSGASGGVGGAIAGGLLSAAGGIYDASVSEKLRNESLDLTKDQFNYSLDNIKSLPNTLSRVSAFDSNNKLFPILEYYSCSDQEKDIFKNKMTYNGMTIMRIDKISNFIVSSSKNYIKGKLIRIDDLDEAMHEANALAEEINKGAYF